MHAQLAEELGNPAEYRRLDTLGMRARVAIASGPAKRSSGKPRRIAGDDDSDVAPAWIDAPGVRDISRIGSADASLPNQTAQVTPSLLTRAHGCKLVHGLVVDVEVDGAGGSRRVRGVRLEDGTVLRARSVVVAMGPWSSRATSWFQSLYGILCMGFVRTALHCDSVTMSCSRMHCLWTHWTLTTPVATQKYTRARQAKCTFAAFAMQTHCRPPHPKDVTYRMIQHARLRSCGLLVRYLLVQGLRLSRLASRSNKLAFYQRHWTRLRRMCP
jgi:glycine/D-amino acid oxidase-like deaminating enzyme